MTVVLIPIFAEHGQSGVLAVGLIAGALVLLAGVFKLGRHVHRLPTSIIEGFTAGIAIVIATQQIPSALGADSNAAPWTSPTMALATAVIVYVGSRRWQRAPIAIGAIAVMTILDIGLNLETKTVPKLGELLAPPSADFLWAFATWPSLLVPSLLVAALASLESLLSAKVADRMKSDGSSHDSDRELLGQGLANIVVPFFGGVPATAALARTAVNVKAGAETKWAACFHAVFLAGIVLGLSNFVALIPLPALAGVLIATAAGMIKISELRATLRRSKLDAVVLALTFALTVFTNLTAALVAGGVVWFTSRKTRLSDVLPPVENGETLGD
jgi:SulP family sulfate permease